MKSTWLKIIGAVVIGLIVGCKPSVTVIKPALTQENADKFIPNGMRESDVYKVLGTGAVVSTRNHGERFLWYLFPFVSTPPRVDPKIDSMTVITSNGVVTGRQFGSVTKSK
jgi:hypothetical protein